MDPSRALASRIVLNILASEDEDGDEDSDEVA